MAHDGTGGTARSLRPRAIAAPAAALLLAALSGCAVVSVVSTAVSVTTTVAGAAVDVGVGAVKVVGKVAGKCIDAVSGSPAPAGPAPDLKSASN